MLDETSGAGETSADTTNFEITENDINFRGTIKRSFDVKILLSNVTGTITSDRLTAIVEYINNHIIKHS